MANNCLEFLKLKLENKDFLKIAELKNEELNSFLEKYIKLLEPKNIVVCDDSDEDNLFIRNMAIDKKEESKLALKNATIHFDGFYDQARDPAHTKFLTEEPIDPNINSMDRNEGLKEISDIMSGIMKDTTMIIRFFCLGPVNSEFSISCVQITDSPYVSHSESLLYRRGYEQFKKLADKTRFFRFVHSEGELENCVSKNIDKRRIYIDLEDKVVFSSNTQYAGNTIGLKKLAMRHAINLASKEGWLTEHMFLMGVNGPSGRKTYFTGAFPSACGKTSTSMITGEKIVGDDIVYIRERNGKMYSVNVEAGMFGIIDGINAEDDPEIWKVLHSDSEMIFSNILIGKDNMPYWTGSGIEIPDSGTNYSGEWNSERVGENGAVLPASHKNARFTISLKYLSNLDENADNPDGVEVGGVIYGGRDSDTTVPVEEAYNWIHGVTTKGASLESETTAATLGKQGVRKFNPMSNLDFLSVPISKYINNNIEFASKLKKEPKVFSVNYFLKDEAGNFMNAKTDKSVWLKWMELRVHGEAEAIETPTGKIPKYEDLKKLFKDVLNREYSIEDYKKQFCLRVKKSIEKIDRILKIYDEKIPNAPEKLISELNCQKERLIKMQNEKGDVVDPFEI